MLKSTSVVNFIIHLCLLLTAAQAQDVVVQEHALQQQLQQELNITTPLEDYVIHNERQNNVNILRYEAELDAYRRAYLLAVNTIYAQSDLLSSKLREVNEKINPLELLDDLSKHCIQKYRGSFATADNLRNAINNCASSANSYISTILSSPDYTKRSLNSYYVSTLPTALNNCKRTYANALNSLNHTICVINAINAANTFTINNRKTFDSQMRTSNSTGDSRLRQALDCSLINFYEATAQISTAQQSIDRCIDGLEFCPKCSNSSSSAQCENYIDVSLHEADFKNATLRNPLLGMNTNLRCLTVNFWNEVQSHVQLE